MAEVKAIDKFYMDFCEAYHQVALLKGYAKNGQIFIRNLIDEGEKIVLGFFKNQEIAMQFGNDPSQYYFVIMESSIQAGMVMADKWNENGGDADAELSELIQSESPAAKADELIEKQLNFEGNDFAGLCDEVFKMWAREMGPYWSVGDPRDYLLRSMIAAYQLGVSIMLGVYGYGVEAVAVDGE